LVGIGTSKLVLGGLLIAIQIIIFPYSFPFFV